MDWTIIILRVLHVGGGLFWAGAGLTMGLFVQPTAQAQGRAGGELMQRLMGESGLGRAMGISAIAALGSGIALYWIDYGEVVPFNASMAAFAVGGLAALIVWLATAETLPATSMARPLERLVEMGLVRREVPFGEPERKSKRAIYRIADPFFRLWFRVVAPYRGLLAAGSRETRLELLDRFWKHLVGEAWEDLCRHRLARLGAVAGGPWAPAGRWWRGDRPEWDVVAATLEPVTVWRSLRRGSTLPISQSFD